MRDDPNILFDLFVPADGTDLGIDPRSAIVASVTQRGQPRLLVHFEGNRFGAENLRRYEERCLHAADRAAVAYPTIAKENLPIGELVRVGQFDLRARRVVAIERPDALAAWLAGEPLPAL